MPLHLIKLCVGAESIDDLAQWQAERLAEKRRRGEAATLVHTTRQTPRRRDDVLSGGSLYWVIRGVLLCRQPVLDLVTRRDGDGIERCDIHLGHALVRVEPRPRGPFQGWRYFEPKEAPGDLDLGGSSMADLPEGLVHELHLLGVR